MIRLLPFLATVTLGGCIVIPLPAKVAEDIPFAIPLPAADRPSPAPGPAPASAKCPASAEAAAYQAHILSATNALRAQNGLPSLRASPSLARVAQAHACDNAAQQSYSHAGSDGSTLTDRLARGRYKLGRAAENTGLGFAGNPERMMSFWVNSPRHRDNLLDPGVTELGLGLADGAKPAWVLVLATPR